MRDKYDKEKSDEAFAKLLLDYELGRESKRVVRDKRFKRKEPVYRDPKSPVSEKQYTDEEIGRGLLVILAIPIVIAWWVLVLFVDIDFVGIVGRLFEQAVALTIVLWFFLPLIVLFGIFAMLDKKDGR